MRFRPEVLGVRESPLVQVAMAAETVENPFRLYYGESDTPTPEFICRAAYDASLAGHTFYTDPSGCIELRQAIADKTRELHGVEYRPTEVAVTIGASQAISLTIRAFVGPGDNAVILSPAYSIFSQTVTLYGGEPRDVPLTRGAHRFELDVEAVERRIDERTRLLVVNSPSNPTGWMATEEEQRALWEIALRHDLVLLSDEVYERLVFDESVLGPHGPVAPSMARIATDRDHLVVVNSFSKTYNMTGWRLGWALASERTIAMLAKVEEFMTSSAPAMIQQAGIVALRDGEPYVTEVRSRYASRRDLVRDALQGIPGVSLPEVRGAFYAFPHVEGMKDSTAFATDLLRRTSVALAPGVAFGAGGEGHLRLCFASSEAVLEPAVSRLSDALRR